MITRSPRLLSSALLAAPLFLLACGSTSSGPAASGGASGSGGKTGSGGSGTGGATGTGGSGTGGAMVASGGATGSGGKTGTGGVTGSGGAASGGANGGGGAAGGTKGGTGGTTGAGGGGGSNPCAFGGGSVTAALYPKGLTLTKACSPYMIDTVDGITLDQGGVLTIEAGTTLIFNVNTFVLVGKNGSGKLLVNGTAQAPVTMTSIAKDLTMENWNGLRFSTGTVTGSLVSYTVVDYAGDNLDAGIFGEATMPKNSVTLDHVMVNHLNTCAIAPVAVEDPNPNMTSFIIKTCTADGKPCPP
jgi:hypothetical protein